MRLSATECDSHNRLFCRTPLKDLTLESFGYFVHLFALFGYDWRPFASASRRAVDAVVEFTVTSESLGITRVLLWS